MLYIDFTSFPKERRKLQRGFPTGTIFFTGGQGAGKSLSATRYIKKLKEKYPDAYIYSNIKLRLADQVISSDEVADHILDRKILGKACGECTHCMDPFDSEVCVDQKEIPIIFFLDEIQTVLFNNKKSVSFETFKAICQQRKALKSIVGTMQEFLDLDIQYRRQLRSVVECTHWGYIQLEFWKDPQTMKYDQEKGDYTGRIEDIKVWKRHNTIYDLYDTLEIVNASMQIDQDKKRAHLKQQSNIIQGSTPT